ncbi:MAG: redoxin domain-containing protein, partial [Verrucomicrobiota bacterium]
FSLAKYLERFPNRAAQSEKLFESVVEKYADVPHWRGTLGDAAKAELFELRHLAIGKVAPEIEGEDLDGNRFKLSEYRGKVVVLDFWGDW